jgi:hypothetical protein
MHYVMEATYVSEYKIKVRFEDGEVRLIDLAPHLSGPIFEPLKNLSFFKSLKVNTDIDTVTWPNAADFSPDFLYEIGHSMSEQQDAADG